MPETEKTVRISDIFNVTMDYLLKNKTEKPNENVQPDRSPDFFSSLGHLIKTRWYCIGYVVILWGAICQYFLKPVMYFG